MQNSPTPDPVPIDYFRSLCQKIGSEREVADLLHVNRSTVCRWRTGQREIPWVVADYLQIKIERMRGGEITATDCP